MNTDQIHNIIDTFLKKMNIAFDAINQEESELPEYTKFVINTPDSGILIGKDGEHLTALGFVLRRVVEKQTKEGQDTPKFFIDIGGYQSNKIQRIQKIAHIMAERAESFKRDIELPPMSAYERMVIHSTLSDNSNVKTESEGQGPTRRVIVRYLEEEVV